MAIRSPDGANNLQKKFANCEIDYCQIVLEIAEQMLA